MPLTVAYTFYNACCGCTGATARFVVEKTRERYCEWHCSRSKRHIPQYYNMLFKKLYHLNGSLLNQQKLLLPEPSLLFGIDDTTHPHKIRRKIEELHTMVMVS